MMLTEGEVKRLIEALNNPDDTAILRDKFFVELDKDILIYEEDGCDAIRVQEEEEQEVICNEFYSIKEELYDEKYRWSNNI